MTRVWHSGELAMQRSAGVAERMELVGRVNIRPFLLDQHRAFFPTLPFVVLGAVDPAGDVWATVRAGEPGFVQAPDAHHLRVSTARDACDPADPGLGKGAGVGLLGVDLATRRRNRLNGIVRDAGPDGFAVKVRQSFGNCPKYIRPRDWSPAKAEAEPAEWMDVLDGPARAMVLAADTFFVASYVDGTDGAREVDVSHRGGPPGFVQVDAQGMLTIPDFPGNRFFNTLGNVLATGRAGLALIDFERGDILQITGDAMIAADIALPGTERTWRLAPRRMVRRPRALPLKWAATAS